LAFVADGLLILDEDFEPLVTFRPDGRSWFSDYGGDTYWHSDGEWLFVGDDAAVTGGNARLIGIAKNDGTVRRDLDTCYIGQCYGWLPATVDINQLPQGQSHSVVPEPSRVLHGSDWCLYLSWSPDGRQILCSTNRWQYEAGATLIFDVESGGVIGEMDGIVDYDEVVEWTLENVQYVPNDVDIQHQHWGEDEYSFIIGESPDGAYTIVRERHVNVYDSATKTLIFSTELFYNSPFVSFNTDGSIMALADNLVRVRLYDTTSWEHIITLKTNATALAFSPDGETLAVASSWDIQLWDVETLLSNTSE
jgi:WD40 repeat protein